MSLKLMKKRWISAASESETDSSVGDSVRKSESKDVEEVRLEEPIATDERPAMEEAKAEQPKQMPHFVAITENEFTDDDVVPKEARAMRCQCTTSEEERSQGHEPCGENCINRMLFMECGSRCPCGVYCANKRFQKRQYAKIEPFFTGVKGWGIRATEALKPGTFIIEYVGEVLGVDDFKQRSRRYGRDPEHKHHYFMALRNGAVIDATERGNISRFVNHSCDPNAETQKWMVDRQLRIGFFTTKSVAAGEEIVFDYQFERYGKTAQKCHCGSSLCRGFIGGESNGAKAGEEEEEDMECDDSDLDEDTRPVKEVESVARRKRQKALIRDQQMAIELDKMLALGKLRNLKQVVAFNRLMVRGDEFENRMKMLDLLLQTEEIGLRLFIDNHGLKLIWMWLIDEENIQVQDLLQLRIKLLTVLEKLPIQTKNQLEDSNIAEVVKRFAHPQCKRQSEVCDVVRQMAEAVANSGDPPQADVAIRFYFTGSDSPGSSGTSADVDGSSTPASTSASDETVDAVGNKLKLLALRLLDKWKDLKDHFRIPRKEKENGQKRPAPVVTLERRSSLDHRSAIPEVPSNRLTWNVGRTFHVARVGGDRSYNRYNGGRSPLRAGAKRPARTPPEPNKPITVATTVIRPTPPSASPTVFSPTSVGASPATAAATAALIGVRRRASRFDRKTPPHLQKDDTKIPQYDPTMNKDEWRKMFAESVMSKAKEDELKAQQMEFEQMQFDVVQADTAAVGLVATTPYPGQPHLGVIFPGAEKPAVLVYDTHTMQWWWQDQNSGTLVYQANEDQLRAARDGDWSNVPHFQYNADEGTIKEVRLNTPSAAVPDESFDPSVAVDPLTPPPAKQPKLRPASPIVIEPTLAAVLPSLAASASVSKAALASAASQRIAELEKQLDLLKRVASVGGEETVASSSLIVSSSSTTDLPASVTEPPPPPLVKLPPDWATATDADGNTYFYNTVTRETQWDPPECEDDWLEEPTTTAAADTSSDVQRKMRGQFKAEIAKHVAKVLDPYRKDNRFATNEDFKYVVRKLSHTILEKEIKRVRSDELKVTDSVKKKSKEYIKEHMKKLGKGAFKRPAKSAGVKDS